MKKKYNEWLKQVKEENNREVYQKLLNEIQKENEQWLQQIMKQKEHEFESTKEIENYIDDHYQQIIDKPFQD